MANVRWLGPPEHTVGLIGIGEVTPGDIIDIDRELADRLVVEGRAEHLEDGEAADLDIVDEPVDDEPVEKPQRKLADKE